MDRETFGGVLTGGGRSGRGRGGRGGGGGDKAADCTLVDTCGLLRIFKGLFLRVMFKKLFIMPSLRD